MNDEHNETTAVAPAPEGASELAPAPAAEPVLLTHEEWADKKGFLPEFLPPPGYRVPPGSPAPGGFAQVAMSGLSGPRRNPKFYRYAAALAGERAGGRWPIAKEITEAEFDAAIETHNSHVCR